MQTQIILLERVNNLGDMGEVVSVKPGFARNYLLPQKKALRATKDNIAYFEAQKKHLEAENEKKKKEAEKRAKKLEGLIVPLIRQASEGGQLYGSVAARDIAEALGEETGEKIGRGVVDLNQNFKTIGLFTVDIILHPEVRVSVTVNIARSADEAGIQEKTGEALISEEDQSMEAVKAKAEEQLEEVLEEGALEAEKEKRAEEKAAKQGAEKKQAQDAEAKAEKEAPEELKSAAGKKQAGSDKKDKDNKKSTPAD